MALGGTFDVVHKGHAELLSHAFQVGEIVLIGVVGDEMAARMPKKHRVLPFADRVKNLEDFLHQKGWLERAVVKQLDDKYGSTVSDPKMEAIIVTRETEGTAQEINRIRRERGLAPLKIETVTFELAEDGQPISTTRIRSGVIDGQGRLLRHKSNVEGRTIE